MKWATKADFNIARNHFPFSCIDLIIFVNNGVVLAMRKDPPYKGFWHLPGGIIHKGETFLQKIDEIANREIGADIIVTDFVGVYENIHRYRHDISCCFTAKLKQGKLNHRPDLKVFKRIPARTIPYHRSVLTHAYGISVCIPKTYR
ncbi:MAG: NUDIX domain-containing protein [Nitrososphaera sp.]